MKISKMKSIFIFLIILSLILGFVPGAALKSNAECYGTKTGNTYNIRFDENNTKITSVVVNFSYVDTADLADRDNRNRQYNLIFTKDASKKNSDTAFQGNATLATLASKLNITDAIYSDAATVKGNVSYVRKTVEQGNALIDGTVEGTSNGYCTLITGTYTMTDRSVLGKFEPDTVYYGLLCSGLTEGGAWYTDVAIEVQITENEPFIVLDDNIDLVVTVTDNHDPAQPGDVLTAHCDADEVTYSWYYDDNGDGIPDEGTFLDNGETYTIKCPDETNPTHDDSGHTIICVATQEKDASGNVNGQKPTKTSDPIVVIKDVTDTAVVVEDEDEVLVYDGTEKKPTITVKDGDDVLVEGTDYDIVYVGVEPTDYGPSDTPPIEEGTYIAIIKFKDKYTGEDKEVEFEIIPKGTVKIDEPETKNANGEKLIGTEEEIIKKIGLTEEDEEAMNNGKNIVIYLEVKDISDSILEADKEIIEGKLEETQKIGMFLDVNLYKKIDGQEPVKITKTKEPVKVSFEIPESLRIANKTIKRTYSFLRLHDGEVTEIEINVDKNIGTFETDEFSIYALTYKDEILESPKTGDDVMVWANLMLVSLLGVIGTSKTRRKINN